MKENNKIHQQNKSNPEDRVPIPDTCVNRNRKDNFIAMYRKPVYTFLLVILSTIILWILYITILNLVFGNSNDRALFGDSFGGLNAFVSSLAFGGIIYTILIQRKELKSQRVEINNQRKEFQINRITSVIYHEVQKYNSALDDIKLTFIDSEDKIYVGESGFRELSEKLKRFMNFENKQTEDDNLIYAIENKVLYEKEVKRLILENMESINYIFNQLYNSARIINLTLKNENIDEQDKVELKTIFILNLGTTMNEIIKMFNLVIAKIAKEELSFVPLNYTIKYLDTFQGNRTQFDSSIYKK